MLKEIDFQPLLTFHGNKRHKRQAVKLIQQIFLTLYIDHNTTLGVYFQPTLTELRQNVEKYVSQVATRVPVIERLVVL